MTAPTRRRDRTPRDSLPVVAVERPRCPTCRSADLQTNRTVTDRDGVATRDVRCRACGQRFFVIVE